MLTTRICASASSRGRRSGRFRSNSWEIDARAACRPEVQRRGLWTAGLKLAASALCCGLIFVFLIIDLIAVLRAVPEIAQTVQGRLRTVAELLK